MPTLYNTFLRELEEFPVQYAFENYSKCIDRLKGLQCEYRADEIELNKAVKQTADLFMYNQWILNEYQGGLSSMLIEEDLNEMIE